MDIPMGSRGTFFTLGATYLKAEVETSEVGEDGVEVDSSFDLNPFVVQAGFGYRF
jgi:outer membrane protein W